MCIRLLKYLFKRAFDFTKPSLNIPPMYPLIDWDQGQGTSSTKLDFLIQCIYIDIFYKSQYL